jgi:hypothetical protein
LWKDVGFCVFLKKQLCKDRCFCLKETGEGKLKIYDVYNLL